MKQTIRLTESELCNMVKHVIKESFPNGAIKSGFDKYTTVNKPGGGADLYSVELGNGGAWSEMFYAFAYDEQEALDAVVDYLEKTNPGRLWDDDEGAETYPDDYITAGNHCHQIPGDEVVIHKVRDAMNESIRRAIRKVLR